MDESLVTVEKITGWLVEQVQHKNPIGPETWLDAAQKIVVLLQSEQESLFNMEQEVAKLRNILLESGKSVAYAKSRIEETEEYKKARIQKAKIEGALELVRISKLQSRMASDVMRGMS